MAEVVVGEEEETGRRPDLNLTLRILVNTLIRKLGSNCLKNRWSFPGRPGRRTHHKKRKIHAFSTVRISAAASSISGEDLAAKKAAAIANVMAAKEVLKKLMEEKEIDRHADIVFGGPTLMDKLTPAEAAMKPAAKPTPTPKKKSILKKPLPLINISATQRGDRWHS